MTSIVGAELLDALPVAVYTTDAEGRITYYNEPAAQLWGHRPELGSRWCGSWRLFWLNGDPLPHDECPMAIALKEGRPVRGVEALAERPDGTRVPFLPYPTPLRDDTGHIIGAVNLLIDLSDRRNADLEAAQLAAIVASSDDAIVSKTLDGIITSWNAGATRIFGYEADEAIGRSILMIIPPELRSEEQRILAQLRRGERIEHFETVRVTKDGRRVDISLTVSPIHEKGGKVVGVSKVARDITESKRSQELQRLLIGELNHRVKNTLATVQAIANQTLRRARSPADFVSSFGGRVQALARAHSLLTQRTWRGTDLRELVHDQLLVGAADDERISCSGPSLMLGPQVSLHLALVLHELGTNARKYGSLSVPTGHVVVTWEVRTEGKSTLILHWRESDGPKVSAPSERGFGATLIEQSLQAHGGSATISYMADGLTCEIKLPLPSEGGRSAYGMTGAIPLDPSLVPPSVSPSALSGMRVAVIEDEPLVAMDMVSSLLEAGCEVIGPAATVQKARSLIESNELDAALLDANLAGEAVDDVAALLARRGVPFAFVTGYGRDALPAAFRDAMRIGKPFTEERLLAGIIELVGRGADVVQLRQKS